MRSGLRRLMIMTSALMIVAGAAMSRALAADSDRSWEIGIYGDEIFPDVSSGIQNSVGYGGRVGYHIKAASEVEITWDKVKGDPIQSGGPRFEIKKTGLMYVKNYLLKNRKNLVPTLVFGLGRVTTDDGSASESDYYYRLGGGAKIFVRPHIAVRLEIAMQRWGGKGDVTPNEAMYSFDATLGVSFLFGGKSSDGGSKPAPGAKTDNPS